ncbi:ABC transporter permease [Salipaludibacillus sp. LMS25]|jgi:ABC-2 type transport system permease protein|uniref:ABC transporter permease n=1 Tax=Salipaludibacillus sp. LMS25 TaxID=2924031 RepID=UPI0020D1A856|nr:ABC transporter permease [Salipaludibacillus sp. LMS25]UTR15808.1 ABC transporter permease [Salipaludibacillus sp. LMS25]
MRIWWVLFKKEVAEAGRNFKWVWLPIVFILLGIMQPVTSYYLPDLLEQFGDLPDGAVLEIPLPSGAQVLAGTFGQFSQIGLLVLVLAFMGTISNEKNLGTHVMVLVKPVSFKSYIVAKWLHILLIAFSSFIAGYCAAIYYTFHLIENVPFLNIINAGLIYLLWLTFYLTLMVSLSALSKSTAFVAFMTLAAAALFTLLSTYIPEAMRWSPGILSAHSQAVLQSGTPDSYFWLSSSMTVLAIILLLIGSILIFNKKELTQSTS